MKHIEFQFEIVHTMHIILLSLINDVVVVVVAAAAAVPFITVYVMED